MDFARTALLRCGVHDEVVGDVLLESTAIGATEADELGDKFLEHIAPVAVTCPDSIVTFSFFT